MSFEEKLKNFYMQGAHVADMGGYGLSGGAKRRRLAPKRKAKKKSGGTVSFGNLNRMPMLMEGGAYGPGTMYPHSFPMPGFFPGPQALANGLSGGMHNPLLSKAVQKAINKSMVPPFGSSFSGGVNGDMGCGLSGGAGRSRKVKNPNRVAAGLASSAHNSWLAKVSQYRLSHPGVSQKDAMIALKNS